MKRPESNPSTTLEAAYAERGLTRRTFAKTSAAALCALALGGLAGCATKTSGDGSGDGGQAQPDTWTITDLAGDTVEMPARIDSIVDLWHAHNQIVLMLGAGAKLVGTTDNFKKMAWANVVYPDLADIESLVTGSGDSQTVNYEELTNLQPSVVFASSKDMVQQTRDNGFVAVNVMFQDYDGLRNDVALTAEILGDEAKKAADAWKKLLDGNIDRVARKTDGIADADKPKVLHIVNKSSFTKVDGTDCIVNEWIELAGGVNAISEKGNMIEVTMEDIIAADPDVIIIGSGAADAVDALKADSAWSGITAVKNDAVYANPTGVFAWDRYSGEEALQVIWAAKMLNPDLFADVDMAAETKDFYRTFYGYDLTDDQAARILEGENPA